MKNKNSWIVLIFFIVLLISIITIYYLLAFELQDKKFIKLEIEDKTIYSYVDIKNKDYLNHNTSVFLLKNESINLKIKEIIYDDKYLKIIFDTKFDKVSKNLFLDQKAYFYVEKIRLANLIMKT